VQIVLYIRWEKKCKRCFQHAPYLTDYNGTQRHACALNFIYTLQRDIFCHSLLLFATLYWAVFVFIFDILPSLLLFTTLHLNINCCCLRCYVLALIIVICDYILRHSLLFCVMLYCVIYQFGYHHPVVFIKSVLIIGSE